MAYISFYLVLCLTFFTYADTESLISSVDLLVLDVHNTTGDVFVAGENVLYHLTSDLEVKKVVSIGPELDHPNCLHPSYPCDHRRVLTKNVPHVLKLIYHLESPMLMLCGSLYKGLCQIRLLDNLDDPIWIGPYNLSLGLTTAGGASILFDSPRKTFFSATDCVPDPKRESISAAFVSGKKLVHQDGKFNFVSNEESLSESAIYFEDGIKRTVITSFIDDKFFFVLFIRDDGRKSTMLARICADDPTFKTYTEMPLSCEKQQTTLIIATVAFYGKGYPEVMTIFEEGSLTALYVAFRDEKNFMLCIFPMSQLHIQINRAIEDCYGSVNFTYVINPHSDQFTRCRHQPQITTSIDTCKPGINPYISNLLMRGTGHQIMDHEFSTQFEYYISIFAEFYRNETFYSIIGIERLGIYQTDFKNSGGFSKKIANYNGELRGVALDMKTDFAYILAGKKVLKVLLHPCGEFDTCRACSLHVGLDYPKCYWCNGHCVPEYLCTDTNTNDSCMPTIFKVTPLKGPLSGRTYLTIEGKNFEALNDRQHSVIVAGIDCEVIKWKNEVVECRTGYSESPVSGPVELNMHEGTSITSDEKFSYVNPKLYGIYPSKGVMSGGTNVTLFGENLDAGKIMKLIVAHRKCVPFRIHGDSVACTTSAQSERDFSDSMRIEIDSQVLTVQPIPFSGQFDASIDFGVPLSKEFHYLPDPRILEVHPGKRTIRVEANVTVKGINLDVVLKPRMLVYIPSINGELLEYEEPCWFESDSNGSEMTCSTPSLMEKGDNIAIPTGPDALVAHVAFIMDGVKELLNFHRHFEQQSRFLYYIDPEYKTFDKIIEMSQTQNALEIRGKYMDLVYSTDNTYVTVGNNVCHVSSLTSDKLLCVLPSTATTNSSLWKQQLLVQVSSGNNRHDLGYVVIIGNQKGSSWIIILSVAFAVTFCFSVVGVWYYRSRYLKPVSAKKPIEVTQTVKDSPFEKIAFDINNVFQVEGVLSSTENPLVDDETLRLLEGDNLIIERDHLNIGNVEGSGQFGCVNEGELGFPGDQCMVKVAVKTMKSDFTLTEDTIKEFLNEGLIMKNFRHQNVLRLIGICFENKLPMVVVPFMDNGDLRTYTRDSENLLTVTDLLKFAHHIACGMTYLATKRFVHRDLAARNCVLDINLIVKVADFGLSRTLCDSKYYFSDNRKKKLPYKWMAPECMQRHTFSEQTDVWSYGVALWEILTRGVLPYPTVENDELVKYIKCGHRLPRPQFCSEDVYALMLLCWKYHSKERPTFQDLKIQTHRHWQESSEDAKKSAQLTTALNTTYISSGFDREIAVIENLDDSEDEEELDDLLPV